MLRNDSLRTEKSAGGNWTNPYTATSGFQLSKQRAPSVPRHCFGRAPESPANLPTEGFSLHWHEHLGTSCDGRNNGATRTNCRKVRLHLSYIKQKYGFRFVVENY
jgi:hypothetical protein